MKGHQLIVNKTIVKAFDTFNREYALKAISICSILGKFQIIAVDYDDSLYVDKIDLKEYEAFGNYINKEEYDASSTYAEIIVNESVCSKLRLSEQEMMAAIAHEIGHIMFFFKSDKEKYGGQAEEVYCDQFACKIGLAKPLYTLLNKLVLSGDYQEELVQQIKNRLIYIMMFLV
jgi:deoxycytidylate deaminase